MKSLRVAASSVAVAALTLGAITGIGALPAAADTATNGDFTYTFVPTNVSAGATITSYSGAGGVVNIPENVTIASTRYAVTALGYHSFGRTKVTEVTIPSSVTSIGDYAFVGNALRYRKREYDSDKSSDSEEPMDEYITSI